MTSLIESHYITISDGEAIYVHVVVKYGGMCILRTKGGGNWGNEDQSDLVCKEVLGEIVALADTF